MVVSKFTSKMPNKNNLNNNKVNKSMNKNVNKSMNKNVNKNVNKSMNKNINKNINKSMNKIVNKNVNINKKTSNLLVSPKKSYLSNIGNGFINRLFSYPVRILIIINSLIMPILLFIVVYYLLKYENVITSIINKAKNIEQYVQDNLIIGINLIKNYIKLFNDNDEIKKFVKNVFIPAIINLALLSDKDLTQKERNEITNYMNKKIQNAKFSIDYDKFKNIMDNPYLIVVSTIGDFCNLIQINDISFEKYFTSTINEGPFSDKEKDSVLKSILNTIDNPDYTLIYLLTHESLFFKKL